MALPDIQQTSDTRGVALQHAGIRNIEVPLTFKRQGGRYITVPVLASLSVGLSADVKGANMSRFVSFLSDLSQKDFIELNASQHLNEIKELLGSDSAYMSFSFKHFIDKKAPITGTSAPMSFTCRLEGSIDTDSEKCFSKFNVEIPVGNLCPCSKAISEYGAHNQRSILNVTIDTPVESTITAEWINTLIGTVEEASSCPVYPVLKREDEKFVTEQQFENPKFVEDMVRDAAVRLKDFPLARGFVVEAEALESIHAHNAWASVNIKS